VTILQQFDGDPRRIARKSQMIAVRNALRLSDAERRPIDGSSSALRLKRRTLTRSL
jgi:hypothetical protein